MEAFNHFTCLSYDTIDFLIHSKYVLFGIYLPNKVEEKNISFENEILPHINLANFFEEKFLCKKEEECNVMLVMKKDDFDKNLQKKIVKYTGTAFPESGNFAISVNSDITTKLIDLSLLKLIPMGIRQRQNDCGINAIAFDNAQHKKILLSPDNLLRTFIGGQA